MFGFGQKRKDQQLKETIEACIATSMAIAVQHLDETGFSMSEFQWAAKIVTRQLPLPQSQAARDLLEQGYKFMALVGGQAMEHWMALHITPEAVLNMINAGHTLPVQETTITTVRMMVDAFHDASELVAWRAQAS
jgi:hypothetical protein